MSGKSPANPPLGGELWVKEDICTTLLRSVPLIPFPEKELGLESEPVHLVYSLREQFRRGRRVNIIIMKRKEKRTYWK